MEISKQDKELCQALWNWLFDLDYVQNATSDTRKAIHELLLEICFEDRPQEEKKDKTEALIYRIKNEKENLDYEFDCMLRRHVEFRDKIIDDYLRTSEEMN